MSEKTKWEGAGWYAVTEYSEGQLVYCGSGSVAPYTYTLTKAIWLNDEKAERRHTCVNWHKENSQ